MLTNCLRCIFPRKPRDVRKHSPSRHVQTPTPSIPPRRKRPSIPTLSPMDSMVEFDQESPSVDPLEDLKRKINTLYNSL